MIDIDFFKLVSMAIGGIILGFFILLKGGTWTVNAAEWIADKSGLSRLFIAATIVAFGTSAPELFTSVNANLKNLPGISLGNVVGSNIANVLLVLGISAIIAPVLIDRLRIRIDTVIMLFSTIILTIGMIYGVFSRMAGLLMFLILVGYVFYQYRSDKLGLDDEATIPEFKSGWHALLTLLLGFGSLVVGSELLVRGAVAGGELLNVSEAVIGLTIIAIGTSLPELATCFAAAKKGQSDIIVGGLIGSNIFNILSIIAITALIKPLFVSNSFLSVNLPILIIVTLVFTILLLFVNRVKKGIGIAFVLAYLGFIIFQYNSLIM